MDSVSSFEGVTQSNLQGHLQRSNPALTHQNGVPPHFATPISVHLCPSVVQIHLQNLPLQRQLLTAKCAKSAKGGEHGWRGHASLTDMDDFRAVSVFSGSTPRHRRAKRRMPISVHQWLEIGLTGTFPTGPAAHGALRRPRLRHDFDNTPSQETVSQAVQARAAVERSSRGKCLHPDLKRGGTPFPAPEWGPTPFRPPHRQTLRIPTRHSPTRHSRAAGAPPVAG